MGPSNLLLCSGRRLDALHFPQEVLMPVRGNNGER